MRTLNLWGSVASIAGLGIALYQLLGNIDSNSKEKDFADPDRKLRESALVAEKPASERHTWEETISNLELQHGLISSSLPKSSPTGRKQEVTVFHDEPHTVCQNKTITVDIWSTSSGLDGRVVIQSSFLEEKDKVMHKGEVVKLSNDCSLKLIGLDMERFKPGREQRKLAQFEIFYPSEFGIDK